MYPAQSLCRLTRTPPSNLESGHFSTISGGLCIFNHPSPAGEF